MNIKESYNYKSYRYDIYRKNCPGWNEIKDLIKMNENLSILDVGCGTGIFLDKIKSYDYKELHGIDPSISMINKAYDKIKNIDKCKVWQDYIENIEDNRYDIILCNQVIQNLTLDKNNCFVIRNNFYNELYRVLKPNGQLILTTRNVNETYSNMYWYCDENILSKSIDDMSTFVPNNLYDEINNINKFKDINILNSNDLIYKDNCYKNINILNDKNWYAADSFWSHVERNNELENFNDNINNLIKKNQIDNYINDRDKLRNNKGHIKILNCYK